MKFFFQRLKPENISLFFFLMVIFCDYFVLAQRFEEFYTDYGIFPTDLVFAKNLIVFYIGNVGSFLLGFPEAALILLFLSIGFVFVRGPRRIMLVLICLCLFLLQYRNLWILDGGDAFMIFFLYWILLFLNTSRQAKSKLQYVFALQLALIYISNGLLKNGISWSEEGSALKIIWSQADISYPWINSIAQKLELKWLTFAALYLERTLPLLLIFRKYRWAAYFFIPYHLVIFATVRIDFFALINLSSWFLLLAPPHASESAAFTKNKDRVSLALGMMILLSGIAQFGASYFFKEKLPPQTLMLLSLTRLNQDWRMFTPDPRPTSYSYHFKCWVGEVELVCPASMRELEQVENWGRRRRQYMLRMAVQKNGPMLNHYFHEYLCRQYPLLERIRIAIDAREIDLMDPSKTTITSLHWPQTAEKCKASGSIF